MIWNFDGSNDFENLFEAFELGTEASMHAQYFFVDKGADWEDVEDISEDLPQFEIVFSFALVRGWVHSS